ncbi:hypothetical protein HPB49_000515 [Dermacentor silvarum]|uniref:Uncharacterized protein n=1 Tax=Dermacentor silvarum TaxID=543639 RepID=A0ACB8D1M0_DERSI|nr:hypothetical protein HPB49_000515 [Dermacentor silvarum]
MITNILRMILVKVKTLEWAKVAKAKEDVEESAEERRNPARAKAGLEANKHKASLKTEAQVARFNPYRLHVSISHSAVESATSSARYWRLAGIDSSKVQETCGYKFSGNRVIGKNSTADFLDRAEQQECHRRAAAATLAGEAARHEELGSPHQLRSKSQLPRQSNKQQQNNARHIMSMEVVVEGEIISPEDFRADAGWMESNRQTRVKILEDLNVEARKDNKNRNQDAEQREAARGWPRQCKQPQAPRLPELPKDDIKIILRPNEGLNVSKTSHVTLRDSMLNAAGIHVIDDIIDTLRTDNCKNIIMISTPDMACATRYNSIKTIVI